MSDHEFVKNIISENPWINSKELEKMVKFLITPVNLRVLLSRLLKSNEITRAVCKKEKKFHLFIEPRKYGLHSRKLSMKDFANDARYAPYLNSGKTEAELEEEKEVWN